MKKIVLFVALLTIFACNNLVEKPENLLSKDQVSDILVDISISEQASSVNPKANMEIGTRYILKKHKISSKEFIDSYKYYTLNKDLPKIVEQAQEKLMERHPGLKSRMEEDEKQNEINKKNDLKIIEGANTLPDFEDLELPSPKKKGKENTSQKKDTKENRKKAKQLPKLEDLNPKTEPQKSKETIKKEDIEANEGSDTPQF